MPNIQKKFGVVYTPDFVVDLMLDKLPDLRNKSICDPSCGDGQFLVRLVDRICKKISRCRTKKSTDAYIYTLNNISGFDIDSDAISKCLERLNATIKEYDMVPVNWKLQKKDAIDQSSWKNLQGFDYIIGNPPYVRIQHLEKDRRNAIKKGDWSCMEGCSDLYVLFFEMGLSLLKDGGKLVYITPNSWMKNIAGKSLREVMRNYNIKSIIDFGAYQVFKEVTTYTAITEIENSSPSTKLIKAHKISSIKNSEPTFVEASMHFDASGWQVVTDKEYKFLKRIEKRSTKLIDIADISVGIQTLADDVFIFTEGAIDIEEEITRKIYKASVMKEGQDVTERRVIYPYIDGNLIHEDVLEESFPKAYKYLQGNKDKLLARDKGTFNPEKWYGYGRDVSILSALGIKILTSSISPYPNFQLCQDDESLFYSGYCVKPREGVPINHLIEELNSKEMHDYIKIVSKPLRNNWFSYAKSFIQNYRVSDSFCDNITSVNIFYDWEIVAAALFVNTTDEWLKYSAIKE